MATLLIDEKGCRDCSLCIDICPTKVLDRDEPRSIARVVRPEDCIGCTSCQYICPSRCITVSDVAIQKPFFRIEDNTTIVRKLLQKASPSEIVSAPDIDKALVDVSFRLKALAESVTETMGRGGRAVGRKAGSLAAAHLPEMYEGTTVDAVLQRMKRTFAGSFDFESSVEAAQAGISMTFPHCGMHKVVEQAGGKIGDHVLCQLFHEYWAGLLGTFTGKSYSIDMTEVGARCTMKLEVRN